jgi:phosphatidylserine decarboxylase
VLLLVALAVLLFFRDPHRESLGGPDAVIAPADGRVVGVDTLPAGHPLAPDAVQRISIFMSPLDVHINRAPVDGVIEAVSYRRGRFSAAYRGDASEINEANALLIRARAGYPVVVVQIAGWLARRIVCDVAAGHSVTRGGRFGLIMFGSRVDVYLPAALSIKAAPGDRVRAGKTVIAQ